MKIKFKDSRAVSMLIVLAVFAMPLNSQEIKDFGPAGTTNPLGYPVDHSEQFNGYTNYWQDNYYKWFRYGNLFKKAVADIDRTILQSKLDVAEDMGFPGLVMQEGFISDLFKSEYILLEYPSLVILEEALAKGDILILSDIESEMGQRLLGLTNYDYDWPEYLKSHQFNARDLKRITAFQLSDGNRNIFAILTDDRNQAGSLLQLIKETKIILDKYQMHKGWFGAKTLLNSVTCTPGHPIELIGKGMNEGCDWFIFNGYMDFLAQDELHKWINDVDLDVYADVGFDPIYGLHDYNGLQVQDMGTKKDWYDYAKSKAGYVFRPVYDTAWDGYPYDGFVAIEGNKEQIDNEDVPFIAESGMLYDNLTTSMVLFIEKSKELDRESLWEAILDRRSVAVLENALMMGPANFRHALELLFLDRLMPEGYFNDRLDIEAHTEGYDLYINIRNLDDFPVSGSLSLKLPDGMKYSGAVPDEINLAANSGRQLKLRLEPSAKSMAQSNPLAVYYRWEGKEKGTIAMLDLPPAISLNRILYASANGIEYPVSIHNFSQDETFQVELKVYKAGENGSPVLNQNKTISCKTGDYLRVPFDLELGEGNYIVEAKALGTIATGQLGVEKANGSCRLYEVDMNNDGIMEYRMENDSVQISLIKVGARVIEYYVKSRNDNVLFKLWPEKPIDDRRPFRKRGFYPFGGFEDFLGQASMETHQVYNAEIIKSEGDFVRVAMETDYYGNKLKKVFTLYGNSPLLEVRFELDFINPEANMLGPQPILELGKVHGPEDVFTVLTDEGYQEYRMRMEDYYGNAIFPKEGWNAGYDTVEDISFVGAYPVDQPIFLHLWMNHPRNKDSHFYYTEFQPWTPIIQKNTMYFTYYLWGTGGPWKNGVEELRKRNLISVRN
jgi:hypothetical protein